MCNKETSIIKVTEWIKWFLLSIDDYGSRASITKWVVL
jgi:hypothetical protein